MKKTVLITGASRGIGQATAKLFAQNHYNVVVNYFKSEFSANILAEEIKTLGTDAIAICADVSNQQQVQAMFHRAQKAFGHIDVLVNNAGIASQALFTDISAREWQRTFDVNVHGAFHCCQCALPQMIRNQAGKIINISSVWGMTGASCEVHYSASKAALIGLTKALAKEVGPSRIQVNCVAPGVIETEMNSNIGGEAMQELIEQTPLQTTGIPEDIAALILFLASSNADFITGQVISPNGGFLI